MVRISFFESNDEKFDDKFLNVYTENLGRFKNNTYIYIYIY